MKNPKIIGALILSGLLISGSLVSPFIYKLFTVATFPSLTSNGLEPRLENLTYTSSNKRIKASLLIPPGTPKGYVVFAHGHRIEGRNHPFYDRLIRAIGTEYAILAFDFYGFGESERIDEFAEDATLDFSDNIVAGAKYLSDRFSISVEDVHLIGHSYGAHLVILTGQELKSNRAIAIGIGNFERALQSSDYSLNLVDKLDLINIDATASRLQTVYRPLFPDRLFGSCLRTNLTLIWGELDEGRKPIEPYVKSHNEICDNRIVTVEIPLANHSFWGEGAWGWRSRTLLWMIGPENWMSILVTRIFDALSAPEGSRGAGDPYDAD